MNIGQMLVELGYTEKPVQSDGFPCPAIICSRELSTIPIGYGAETKAEVEAHIDFNKTVGQRATTKRSAGNWS